MIGFNRKENEEIERSDDDLNESNQSTEVDRRFMMGFEMDERTCPTKGGLTPF